ncbi:uncharacterized protein LOC110037694, partial [Phalaenopsis equestris]|uniref:uncharacterized protein LOC110037694 n=1 Tax=Phalaenopsis equestris TaxID=78828 RepID=UPI0009E393DD
MVDMGYQQVNADHTIFFQQHDDHTAILTVYVDDIIITGDDEAEIVKLNGKLEKQFEINDLGQLRYFLRIEVAHEPERIVLTQRKYVLNLLTETSTHGCKPAVFPIYQVKLSTEEGQLVDYKRYQRLVGHQIYPCHTRPDISFAVSV